MQPVPSANSGLYIHFPWCVKKCPYCDFNSHRVSENLDHRGYIETLLTDLDYELSLAGDLPVVDSIFMGGGTPSLFDAAQMDILLRGVSNRLQLSDDAEITMEANPGTLEHADFAAYRQAGINRLSLGVQSFNQTFLNKLGRIHSADEAIQAFNQARNGGFDNINLDLMFALPDQTPDQAQADIESATALQPEHISAYQLTLEPDTVFARYPPSLPDDDSSHQIESAWQHHLQSAGYQRYEVSAYSRDGKQCRHNLNYWQFGDYLGIGAGAHGKQTVNGRIIRRSRKKHPATYIGLAGNADSIAETKPVTQQQVLFEYMMNALRLTGGVTLAEAVERTGSSENVIREKMADAVSNQLVTFESGRIRCTASGYLFLDSILSGLL